MKTTQVEQKAQSMRATSETVRDFLSFDELEYNTILFECGLEFLVQTYGLDSKQYILHSRTKLFWSWYRMQFDHCAASYLARASNLTKVKNMKPFVLIGLFNHDISFFCVRSKYIKTSFENYLNAHNRYGKRSGKGIQNTAGEAR